MSDAKKAALAAIAVAPEKVNAVHFLKQTGKLVQKRVELIFKVERDAAFHALSLGLQLWQVKTLKPEGGFQNWIEANVPERGYRSCAYYMKLAHKFAIAADLQRKEAAALLTLKPGKAPKGGPDRVAFDKAVKFIGDNSLTDLLIAHGCRSGSAAQIESDDSESGGTPALTDASGQMFFTEIAEHLMGLRETVLKPENLMRLEPKQLDALKAEIEQTRTEFLKLYEKARGKK